MKDSVAKRVQAWHANNGGHFHRPAGHALRLLCEVVELCVVTGALPSEIQATVLRETKKATDKDEWGGTDDPAALAEEWVDCAMLLEVFRHYAKIDEDAAALAKLMILHDRDWMTDEAGVLWRPGLEPEVDR
jgi:hypothetical protein